MSRVPILFAVLLLTAHCSHSPFNILLQYSIYPLHNVCSDDDRCYYYIHMPVGYESGSDFPTSNLTLALDLSSAHSFMYKDMVKTMKCEEDSQPMGCVLDEGYATCSILNKSLDCQKGWITGLLFNHSYEYSPRGLDSNDNSGSLRTDLHPSQIPFLHPIDYANTTTNMMGLSPSSEFNTFVKSVYTIKYSEFSFTINENFQLEIQPNLILYNTIFQQEVGLDWTLKSMSVFYNRSSLYIQLERGTNPICISFLASEIIYVRQRDGFVKELMQDLCGQDECEYTEDNIRRLAPISMTYRDPKRSNLVYQLNLQPQKYTIGKVVHGKRIIDFKIGDISSLSEISQCDSSNNVALGISYFKYFRFEFVFGKKDNFIRFHEKNDGLTVKDKFYLLNFGGALLLLVMLAVSIRVAYKYM